MAHFSYLAIFLFLIIGSLGVPFPEEIVLILSGYLAYLEWLRLDLVMIVSFIGVIVADTIGYYIGHHGGRLVKWVLAIKAFRNIEWHFKNHACKTIFFSRFLSTVRTFIPIAAGAAGMPFKTFITYDALAALVWVPLATMAGYLFGKYFELLWPFFKRVEVWATVLALFILVVGYFSIRLLRNQRGKKVGKRKAHRR